VAAAAGATPTRPPTGGTAMQVSRFDEKNNIEIQPE
jgi:hypothetical protein